MQTKKHRTKQTSLFFLTAAMLLLIGISFLILFGTAPQTEANGQSPNKKVTTAPAPAAKNQPKKEKFPAPAEEFFFQKEILSDKITAYLEKNEISAEKISFCIRNFVTGEEVAHNETEDFTAASVYKLPLAMLYYEAEAAGKISFETALVYEANAYEPGGPVGDNYAFGSKIPLKTLLFHLIVHSDNTAGHILFENMGGWTEFRNQAQKYARSPLNDSFFSRKNILTAQYTADVLQYLYENKKTFSELIRYLAIAQPNDYLNYEISEIAVQKYGSYGSAVNAAGLVLQEKPYAIAVFTDLGDAGRRHIGAINRICYETFYQENATEYN